MGVLGVVGPKRMEYPRMMALVDYTAALVSQILTTGRERR
jgi:transcriptional regulator of heat shock response